MRASAIVCGLGALMVVAGCSSTRWGFVKNGERTPASTSSELPTVTQLVEYLNDNAGRIRTVRVEDLDMTCSQGIKTFGLRGVMVAEKPSNFRLGAKLLGNPMVDLGSNEQEFWYWISKADPPYQVYCSYADLKEGRVRRMPFPFQPEWVMESMGLGPYGPPDRYKLEHDRDTIKLVEKTTSPQGAAVRKMIVFKKSPVEAPRAQVTDYLLVDDASGKELCSAHIGEVQVEPTTGAILPRRLELRWPSERLTLSLRLNDTVVNTQVSPQTFTRRLMPDIQPFNLARMQVDSAPPPQATPGVGASNAVRPAQALAP